MNEVLAFAKAQGYTGALPLGKWRGYEIFEPVFESDGSTAEAPAIGVPLMIMKKGDEIRMSTVEEAYQQLDELED